jgi:hypothetical protein
MANELAKLGYRLSPFDARARAEVIAVSAPRATLKPCCGALGVRPQA